MSGTADSMSVIGALFFLTGGGEYSFFSSSLLNGLSFSIFYKKRK